MASTGVIGVELPMNLIRDHTPRIDVRCGDKAGLEFAKAIMTTDTHAKHIAVRYEASDGSDRFGRRVCQGCGDDPPEYGDDALLSSRLMPMSSSRSCNRRFRKR